MTRDEESQSAIRAVWSIESAKLTAGITRITRDLGLAEELAQDALLAALEQWPESGVPENPWRLVAGHGQRGERSIICDAASCSSASTKSSVTSSKHAPMNGAPSATPEAVLDEDVGDDVLRLVFIALPPDPRPPRHASRSPCACWAA